MSARIVKVVRTLGRLSEAEDVSREVLPQDAVMQSRPIQINPAGRPRFNKPLPLKRKFIRRSLGESPGVRTRPDFRDPAHEHECHHVVRHGMQAKQAIALLPTIGITIQSSKSWSCLFMASTTRS